MSENIEVKKRKPKNMGPHGLGDPDDLSLRKVEETIVIPKQVTTRAREEKCTKEVADFTNCCKDAKLMLVFKCRQENTALNMCLEHWFHDAPFVEECRQRYLYERSEYRRTGIPVKKLKSTRFQSNI